MTKFYEDEVYIKMCEKAGEIQNDHSIKKFDLFQDNNSKDIFSYDDNMMRKYIGKWIWLPRQDQLQERVEEEVIIIDAFSNMVGIHLAFTDWIVKSGSNDKHPYYGYYDGKEFIGLMSGKYILESLWLMWYMEVRFSKTWNGEDWVNG